MKRLVSTTLALALALAACGGARDGGYDAEPPTPAPDLAAAESSEPYVPTEAEAQAWAEETIGEENAEEELKALEEEIESETESP